MRQVIDLERELTDAGILSGPLVCNTERAHIQMALELVAKAHGVTVAALKSSKRYGSLSRARRDAYAALRNLGMSLQEIGVNLNKDHSTVKWGLRKRENELLQWKVVHP